jgi:hypothetical protein
MAHGRSLTLSLERRSLTGLKPHLVVLGWEISQAGLVAGPPKAGWKPALRQLAIKDNVKLRPSRVLKYLTFDCMAVFHKKCAGLLKSSLKTICDSI